jgi:MFS family permease
MHYAANLVSWLGDGIMALALSFAVLEAGGGITGIGIVVGTKSVALLAVLLFGGVLGDRVPRRAVMMCADIARFVSQGVVAVLVLTGQAQLWHFVVSQLVHGVATALFNPASSGLLPHLVSDGHYQQANALRGLSSSVAMVTGPAIAGVLVAVMGPGWALVVDSATFLVSAGFVLAIRVEHVRPVVRSSFLRDLADGWVEFRSRTWLWVLVCYASLANMLFAAFVVLGPVISLEAYGGARDWGFVLSAVGIGSAMGGVLALRAKPYRPLRFAVLASAAFTLAPLGLAAGFAPWALFGLTLLGGVGLTLFNTLWDTAVQENVPKHMLSRVSAYEGLGVNACQPIGQFMAGPIAATIGGVSTLWISGGLQLLAVVVVLLVPSVALVTSKARSATSVAESR